MIFWRFSQLIVNFDASKNIEFKTSIFDYRKRSHQRLKHYGPQHRRQTLKIESPVLQKNDHRSSSTMHDIGFCDMTGENPVS